MSSGIPARIAMSDINSLLDAPLPKKGKKPVAESSSKPPSGVMEVANTRKRKAPDVVDLEVFETHDPDHLRSLMHSSVDKVIDALKDFKKKKEIAEATNEELKSQSASFADKMLKDSQELKAMRKEVKNLKGAAAKHQQELEDVRQGALASAAALVLEGKIKLVKEIRAPGFDLSSIDLEAWEAKLAFLKGEDAEVAEDEAGKVGAEGDGAEEGPEAAAGEKDVTPGDDSSVAKA